MSNTTIRAGVLLSLTDSFSPGIRKAGTEVSGFGAGVASTADRINKAFSGIGAKVAGVGLSIGAGAAINGVIDLDARMERLGTQADASAEKMAALKNKIFETARSPDIKIDQGELIGALDQIIERTGDMKFAADNLRSIGLAIQATGASGADIGGLFAEFQKMGLGADEAFKALDTLTKQGKQGAFTLQNLAGLGPRTISAYVATGRSGAEALREMGAALQVIRMGTGSSEQAATAFEAVMRNLTDPAKQKELRRLGVSVKDQSGNFKSITTVMEEIVKQSGGSTEALGQVFDAEAMRAFNFAIGEFKRTGGVESIRKFYQTVGDGKTITADSARNAATLKSNITLLQTAFSNFASNNLSKPLEAVATQLNRLAEDPKKVEEMFWGITKAVAGLAAVKGFAGIVQLTSNLKGLSGSGGPQLGAAAVSGGLGGGSGTPVFVTNWPVGGLGGAGGAKQHVKGHSSYSLADQDAGVPALPPVKPSAGAKISAGLKGSGPMLAVAAAMQAASAGIDIARIASDDTMAKQAKAEGIGKASGQLAGGTGGMVGGAVLGSLILPGIGTMIGASIGGVVGNWLGSMGGELVGGIVGKQLSQTDVPTGVPYSALEELYGRASDTPAESKLPARSEKNFVGAELKQRLEVIVRDEKSEVSVTQDVVNARGLTVNTGDARMTRGGL